MVSASRFPATRWTLILSAGREADFSADRALAELCRTYWYPIYAFVRRAGYRPEDAQDLTQDFFSRFLERRYFSYADPAKGRFRSFLLTSVKRFLADQVDRRHAEKRGGREGTLALDLADAEARYGAALADHTTPERLFEREWAVTLLARVKDGVRSAFVSEGKGAHFEALKQFLPGEEEADSYAEAGRRIGASEGALKVAVHRLRRRYRELFRAEVAHLVDDPNLVDDELRHLLNSLRA